jgi:hypothetical protein
MILLLADSVVAAVDTVVVARSAKMDLRLPRPLMAVVNPDLNSSRPLRTNSAPVCSSSAVVVPAFLNVG